MLFSRYPRLQPTPILVPHGMLYANPTLPGPRHLTLLFTKLFSPRGQGFVCVLCYFPGAYNSTWQDDE